MFASSSWANHAGSTAWRGDRPAMAMSAPAPPSPNASTSALARIGALPGFDIPGVPELVGGELGLGARRKAERHLSPLRPDRDLLGHRRLRPLAPGADSIAARLEVAEGEAALGIGHHVVRRRDDDHGGGHVRMEVAADAHDARLVEDDFAAL